MDPLKNKDLNVIGIDFSGKTSLATSQNAADSQIQA